jgi:hypothetical protein
MVVRLVNQWVVQLVGRLVGWFIGWLVGWLVGWLGGWLFGWLVGWLGKCKLVRLLKGIQLGYISSCKDLLKVRMAGKQLMISAFLSK